MHAKFFVYVLVSIKPKLRFYVGMSENVNTRLLDHNSGKVKSTKPYRPWELFFFEPMPDRKTAREREKHLKGGSGKAMIKRKWNQQFEK